VFAIGSFQRVAKQNEGKRRKGEGECLGIGERGEFLGIGERGIVDNFFWQKGDLFATNNPTKHLTKR
jgi:hypothetical protein